MRRPLIALLVSLPLAGCVVAGRPASRSEGVVVVDHRCQPAHHWEEGVGCVHNGQAKGHYK